MKRAKSRKSISKEEIDRRLKLARAAAATRRAARNSIRGRLARALEMMNESHAYQSTIEIKPITLTANAGKWISPWVIVARIRFKGEIGYDQLYEILETWLSSKILKAVNGQRVTRMRLRYVDPRQGPLDYTLAETAPFIKAVATAIGETDPTDTETSKPGGAYGSLAARYGIVRNKNGKIVSGSLIPHIDIWLSEQVGFRRAPMPEAKLPRR
jgi:hypothetical protein